MSHTSDSKTPVAAPQTQSSWQEYVEDFQRAGHETVDWIAHELASIKKSSGLPVYDSEREQQILNRLCQENQGPLASQSIASIFRCIIRESRRVEQTSMRKLNNNIFKQENHNGHQHGSRRVRG